MAEDLSKYHHPISRLLASASREEDWERYRLSEEQVEFFRENGYLTGIRVLSDEQVEVLRGELEQLMNPEHAGRHLFHEYHSNESTDPDRVLFLTTGTCSTYCRYCTRSRLVGNPGGEYQFNVRNWDRAIEYLEAHTEVRDVLLSGGDPLTIGDDKLDYLLGRLRAIRHIEFLRIGSKIPAVLPQRITKDLVAILKRYHPLWMSLHVTHPRELTEETTESTARLADAETDMEMMRLAGCSAARVLRSS